jgi:hypothetical protein
MAAAVAVSAYSAYSQNQNAKKAMAQQESAQRQAEQNALKQEKAADEASNAANMKSPDTAAMMSSAMLSGKSGQSGTMLTGAQGVTKDKLGVQKNTLLGA